MQWRTCTDTPIALSKPHIISVSAHVANFEHNQFSRSKYIEVGCARAHVHSDTMGMSKPHNQLVATYMPNISAIGSAVPEIYKWCQGCARVHVQ